MSLLPSGAIETGGYNINNSLRFRQSATAYLSRTFTTPTNNKIATISLWRKRGSPGTYDTIYGTVSTTTGNGPYIQFNTDNLRFVDNSSDLTSSQVFRDYSAWYHIVVAIDTTQATASNRVKMYVNGSQITAFSSATYGALNYNSDILSSGSQYIGYSQPSNARGAEGYLAEVNFIDGQALTPSSFGETDAVTGSWVAKKYTGTYGTNGFYLKFSDIATTSGSNAGLGKDFSGNSNYWTTNNISVTSGTTYDAMTDSPTLTSATVANYSVLNPLGNAVGSSPSGYLSNANLTVSGNANAGYLGTMSIPAGKYYFEGTLSTLARQSFGLSSATISMSQDFGTNLNYYGFYFNPAGNYIDGSANPWAATAPSAGSIVQVAVDATNPASINFWVGINNVWYNSTGGTTGNPSTGANPSQVITANVPLFPLCTVRSGASSTTNVNFGQRPFTYTPPTGFVALNTYNLPDSTIKKGNSYMDAVLWTGDGTSSKTVSSYNFAPDFLWGKNRTTASIGWWVYDTTRGAGNNKELATHNDLAEGADNEDTYGYLSAFTSNGFTGVNGTGSPNYYFNQSSATYVAYGLKANGGTTSSNTQGSITSTVQANTTAGFSIVTYTGTGANATVGHGLGVAPKMIIFKGRSTTFDWMVYHTSLGNTNYLRLNQTNASAASVSAFNNTSPTSTVFSLGDGSLGNAASATQVAYCFAEIAGFSKFGSYTGNGSADGPFVYCGFRPRFVLVKCSSAAGGSWVMYDTSRNQYNLSAAKLAANLSEAENGATVGGSTLGIDVLANGFKHRNDGGANHNASGATYIFAAFAENPFKNSLAR